MKNSFIIFTTVFGLVFPHSFAFANYYTLPIDEPGDPDISYTFWFDHDDSSAQKYYDGDDGTERDYDQHHGTDFGTNMVEGKDVLAAATGTVRAVGWENPNDEGQGYGFRTYLYHDYTGQRTLYAHMASSSTVALNDVLARGQKVGDSGNTGTSTNPHLHFGVYNCDCTTSIEQVDPFGWWVSTSTDPWPYNENVYLWTTDPPSFDLTATTTGTISSDETWRGNILVDGTVTIDSGVDVSVDPGTVVKFKTSSSQLSVSGMLNATGTDSAEIYFTSYHDDSVGGDTNYNGTSTAAAAGDYYYIKSNSGGAVNSI